MESVFKLIVSHMIGDYVLQCDYIAKTKGENWYHLLVHCVLYCVPFYFFFGVDWRLLIVLVTHVVIDALKARFHRINYVTDQLLHYLVLMIYVVI